VKTRKSNGFHFLLLSILLVRKRWKCHYLVDHNSSKKLSNDWIIYSLCLSDWMVGVNKRAQWDSRMGSVFLHLGKESVAFSPRILLYTWLTGHYTSRRPIYPKTIPVIKQISLLLTCRLVLDQFYYNYWVTEGRRSVQLKCYTRAQTCGQLSHIWDYRIEERLAPKRSLLHFSTLKTKVMWKKENLPNLTEAQSSISEIRQQFWRKRDKFTFSKRKQNK